ncbi:MAG: DUF3368 domain-containing protein [Flavisolibacter sp.]|nr:DUF3368 domain-containing protein [Flavisolibacter sp.]
MVIADTSCLITLERIGQLHLLYQLFSSLHTTQKVADEFGYPLPQWITILPVSDKSKQEELTRIVEPGEATAIALALETENCLLIIDEKKDRRLAQQLDLQIAGTLQILLVSKTKGIIHSIKALLDQLENNNFRFSPALKDDILRKAGEL